MQKLIRLCFLGEKNVFKYFERLIFRLNFEVWYCWEKVSLEIEVSVVY